MPSKRTNDSVDRILEELNMQQAQAGLRDSVTDHQVDEILRSVGILSLPDEPLPEDTLAFPEGDALDDLLQKPVSQPAPAPAQPRPYTPAQQPDPQPVQPDARTTRPPEQPLPTVDKTGTQTFSGDTTGTGIIKGFLGKMAPGGDAESLDQGKNEFKRFFGTSVAVVPDENGRLHEPGKKKRSLFGLKHAEDTGAFEPINVTMGGGRAVGQAEPEEEYYPDAELEPTPAQPARAAKKHGFFGSLFDREEETEELMIPEERAEEPSPYRPGAAVPPQQPVQTPSAAAVPVQPVPPVPPVQEETSTQEVHPPGPPRRGGERPYRGDHPGHGGLCQKPPVRAVALRHDRHDLPQKEEHRGVHPRPEDPEGPAAAACAAAQRGACGRAHRDAPQPDVHRLHDADRRAGRRPRGQHAGLYGRLQRRAPAAPPGPRAGAARSARADAPRGGCL